MYLEHVTLVSGVTRSGGGGEEEEEEEEKGGGCQSSSLSHTLALTRFILSSSDLRVSPAAWAGKLPRSQASRC